MKEEKQKDNVSETRVGMRFGCLIVQDEGDEFLNLIDKKISMISEEKAEFICAVKEGRLKRKDRDSYNGTEHTPIPAYIYNPNTFNILIGDTTAENDFDVAISKCEEKKIEKHYKCTCRKCGKTRYYTNETLKTLPQYCKRPMYCSGRHTYSNRASNATHRKRDKYDSNEAVELVLDKAEVAPSEKYCESWNQKKQEELDRKAEKEREEERERQRAYEEHIASLPRRYAPNYDRDLVGMKFESLDILSCIDDHYEGTPSREWNENIHQYEEVILVHKKYRCQCYLCGNIQEVLCSEFSINPPTEYGRTAYNGYWSKIRCNSDRCKQRFISSFQWIVNKLLFENGKIYRVEFSFPDLRGEQQPLRFDFAVFDDNENMQCLIECNGVQHEKPVEGFGGESGLKLRQHYDDLKKEYADKHGINLIVIKDKDRRIGKVEDILKKNGVI